MRLNTLSYYADFFLSGALVLVLVSSKVWNPAPVEILAALAFVAAGFATWTLFEYLVHRLLYHNVAYFQKLHDAHHAEPNAFIGAPPVIGVVLIIVMTYVPVMPFSTLAAVFMTSGMLLGYMAYMLLHHAAHYWNLPANSWLYQARRHHALHHFHQVEGNYGITTAFWDHVFGTAIEPQRNFSREKTR